MQPINPNIPLKPLPQPGVEKPSLEQQEDLLKAKVDEFAGLLFAQLVREMREAGASDEEESIFGGGNTNYFMHLFDQEVGKALVQQGGGGLKDALHDQLSSQLRAQFQAKGDSQ